ncbi:MAG: L-threonine 3-dehydrogenase [Clostridia bacterium]|nr:L-threonine 3-dehydrogenase [Clostridia bacterium]
MDALVKRYAEPGIWMESVDVPVLEEGEALIKIHKTAICGTDSHIYNWDAWSQKTIKVPMITGHEFVGEIVEIKGNTNVFKVGDLVSAEGHVVCGKCRNCRGGKRHLCPNTQGIGVNRTGIFAEYAAIPLTNLWLCDRNIDEDILSIFDPFGNATHTALSFEMIGEDVLITGAGPIGIMAAAICSHVGARNVVITDVGEYRLNLAKTVCPKVIPVNTKNEKLADVMKRLDMKEGFDVGLEMSGSSIAFNQMIDSMINGGKIALLGIQAPNTVVDWDKIIFGSLFLKGIYGREMFETWHKMTTMIQSGLDISKVITHRFPHEEYITGFELMKSGMCGKVVLNWQK